MSNPIRPSKKWLKKKHPKKTPESSSTSQPSGASVPDPWQEYLDQCKVEFYERYHSHVACELTLRDFFLMKVIGKGSFGTVVLATSVSSEEHYAIKIIEKKLVTKMKNIHQLDIEKRMLMAIRFPFIVHMEKCFKDNTYIFFVTPFIAGGDMFSAITKFGKFTEQTSAFYAAQVVLAFEYLHFMNVAYRDLKPENILIDTAGYLKLTDLGLAKIVLKRTYTLCGTPEFLAPETILRRGYSRAVDWWSLGVLIFEMCSGAPPFYSKNVTKIYESIVNRALKYPSGFSHDLKGLLEDLFQVDPSRRLGNLKGGVEDIKKHAWFWNTHWVEIFNKSVPAPYIPIVMFEGDTRNFDNYGEISLKHLSKDRYSKEFADF